MTGRNDDRERIDAMLGPAEREIGCDECFDLLDQYVELDLAGENYRGLMPLAHAHFQGCPVCRDEYESLRELATTSETSGL